MAEISFETKCVIVAVTFALFATAVSVHEVRVRRERFDRAAMAVIGLLLGLSLFALFSTVFNLPITGEEYWLPPLVISFGALFAWLVRPRE